MTHLQRLVAELIRHPRLPAVYLDLTWSEGLLRLTLRSSMRPIAVHDLGDGGFTIAYGEGGQDDAFTVADVPAAVGLLMVGDGDELRVRHAAPVVAPTIAAWLTSESSAPPVGVLCVGRWVRVDCDDEIVVARIEEPEYPGGLNAWACACDSGWQTVRPPDFWHPLAPFGGEK